MRNDNCYRGDVYGIVLIAMLLDTGPLNAQEVKGNLLFGYPPADLVKGAKQISFPVDSLSADAPDWKLDGWSINLANFRVHWRHTCFSYEYEAELDTTTKTLRPC